MTRRSSQELFVLLVPAVTVFAIIAFTDRLVGDGDTYWHIRAGEWMLDNLAVIRSDTFSYTFAGQPWQAHEWLSEILMAVTYRAAGWSGLYILAAGSFAATSYLIARELLKHLEPIPALYICLLALLCLKPWIIIRPHVFVLPVIALWMSEMLQARTEGRTPRTWLALVAVLWANLHGSFVLGIALVGFFAIEAVIEKRSALLPWGRIAALIVAATMLTPWGVSGLLFPLQFTGNATTDLIVEWQASTFDTITPLEVSGLAIGFLFLLTGVKMPVWRTLLLLGLIHMALDHRRFVTILAIIGPMIVAEPLAKALTEKGWIVGNRRETNSRVPVTAALVSIALVIVGCFSIPKPIRNNEVTPVAALASVPKNVSSLPVFNDWTFGGLLIFAGLKPYVDGRAELYGYDFVMNYVAIHGGNPRAVDNTFAQNDIAWAILKPTTRTNIVIELKPEWCRTFLDDFAVVHMKREVAQKADAACLEPYNAGVSADRLSRAGAAGTSSE